MGGLFQLFWRRGGDFQDWGHCPLFGLFWPALIGQLIKNPPAMQETLVLFLGWEDLLEKA